MPFGCRKGLGRRLSTTNRSCLHCLESRPLFKRPGFDARLSPRFRERVQTIPQHQLDTTPFSLKKRRGFLVLRLAQIHSRFHTRFLDFTLDSSWAVRHFTRCWSLERNLVRHLPLLIQVARPHVVNHKIIDSVECRDAHRYTMHLSMICGSTWGKCSGKVNILTPHG